LPVREVVTFQHLIDRYVDEETEKGDLAHAGKEPISIATNKDLSPK
jgi:hypothetical protein